MTRSEEWAVSVVNNKKGWTINLRIDQSPYKAYGPYDAPISLPEAFQIVSVDMRMLGMGETNALLS